MATIKPRAVNYVPSSIAQPADRAGRNEAPQASYGLSFYNGLGVPVTIGLRNGVRYVIAPVVGASVRALVIRTSIGVCPGNVNLDTHELLDDQGHTTSVEAGIIHKGLENVLNRTALWNTRASERALVEYTITQHEFESNGCSLYLPNLDILASILNPAYSAPHPYSLVGARNGLLAESLDDMASGLCYRIQIVDRHGRFGDRFVNLAGEVYHIRIDRDSDLPEGVYAYGNHPTNGKFDLSGPRARHYSFEEADKELKLYNTYMEARTLGDPQSQYKRELEAASHANKLKEHELKNERLRLDEEHAQRLRAFEIEKETAKAELQRRDDELRKRERELALLQADNKLVESRIDRDRMLLKDIYDQRALNRKEVIEVLKHAPAFLTGAAALYAVFKKITSS